MIRLKFLLFTFLFASFCSSVKGAENYIYSPDTVFACDTINVPTEEMGIILLTSADSAKTSRFKSKKLIASILSFPFPFGLLGLHRIFLGTKPYIPFVYIGTLGGCFLILPIIDFVAIVSADEETFKSYENNPRVFMWSH